MNSEEGRGERNVYWMYRYFVLIKERKLVPPVWKNVSNT